MQTIRVLTAVPICDGHDSAINTINLELIRHGIEVVYLGYHRSARDIARAAVQEDVQAIGISTYNGGPCRVLLGSDRFAARSATPIHGSRSSGAAAAQSPNPMPNFSIGRAWIISSLPEHFYPRSSIMCGR